MERGNPEALQQPYDPGRIEQRWYAFWEERGVFQPRSETRPGERAPASPFVISIPPPNVTGSLTMGHLLGESIRDVVAALAAHGGPRDALRAGHGPRRHRHPERGGEEAARGRAAAATTSGARRSSREVWEWKEQYGGLILQQLRRLGISPDWTRERFTLDDGLLARGAARASSALYEKGLIYRGRYIVNWCPRCHTALSDEEVDHVETRRASSGTSRYPIKGTEKSITVATTRPETMLGDTAVAVHPKDRRYAQLVGKTAVLPLVRREIPIVADDMVDPKFGTGAVKVTPAHDPNDFQTGAAPRPARARRDGRARA